MSRISSTKILPSLPNLTPYFSYHFSYPPLRKYPSSDSSSPFSSLLSFSSRLYFSLFIISLLFIGVYGRSEFYPSPRRVPLLWRFESAKNLGFLLSRRRVARSPFMHPTVTSFKPPVRRSKKKKLSPDLRIGEPTIARSPPILSGRLSSSRKNSQSEARPLFPEGRVPGVISKFPRPPVIVHQSRSSHPRVSEASHRAKSSPASRESGMPQNDQHTSLVAKEGGLKTGEGERNVAQETNKQASTPLKKAYVTSLTNESQSHEIIGFYQVLETIGKTNEELQEILRLKGISFDTFLSLIDQGTTKDKVFEFLKLTPNSEKNTKYGFSDFPKGDSISKPNYSNLSSESDRKVLLRDLPFTEIVHEVPIRRMKHFGQSTSSIHQDRRQNNYNKPPQRKDPYINQKDYPPKWGKRSNEKKGNFSKSKRNKDKNPYLMNSASTSVLPVKDSPMIIPFLPPKKKKKEKPINKKSASIIALTVEKTMGQIVPDTSPQLLPTRNKVFSERETQNFDRRLASSYNSLDVKEKLLRDEATKRQHLQQSNLRMVFPMKGILMFCGILGAVAAITIMILIIYGAVKCNKKSVVDSYQMSECQSTTATTSGN